LREDILQEKERLKAQMSGYLADLQEQKSEIQGDVQSYKALFQQKVAQFKHVLLKARTGAMVVGGLYIVYRLASWLIFGSSKPKAEDGQVVVVTAPEPSIVQQIKNAIVSFLLSIAQRELMRLVNKLMEDLKADEQQ
jgi:hypothetical protein